MKTPKLICLFSFSVVCYAAPPELATLQKEYEGAVAERVTGVFDAAVKQINTGYVTAVERDIKEAKAAGDLPTVLGLEAEKKLVTTEKLPEDDAQTVDAVKKLRAVYRKELATLESQRDTAKAALTESYATSLKRLEADLTKADRVNEAKVVMERRLEVEKALPSKSAATATSVPPQAGGKVPLPLQEGKEQISSLLKRHSGSPITIKGDDGIITKEKFTPPVEITIIGKTDSTNLRMGYAADTVIFNWERDLSDLRVDGGPASGKHKQGAGAIPTKKFVTIRWRVTRTKQSIYVDGELRYEHVGDYSGIYKPVSVASHKSVVTVKSIKVLQLPPDTK